MGGNALKNIITIRKNKTEFYLLRDKIQKMFLEKGVIIDFIPELDDKDSFGDLDILYSNKS